MSKPDYVRIGTPETASPYEDRYNAHKQSVEDKGLILGGSKKAWANQYEEDDAKKEEAERRRQHQQIEQTDSYGLQDTSADFLFGPTQMAKKTAETGAMGIAAAGKHVANNPGEMRAGMFHASTGREMGDFSDIYQKKNMKWMSDGNAKLRTRKEIAALRRKKSEAYLEGSADPEQTRADKIGELRYGMRMAEDNKQHLIDNRNSMGGADYREKLAAQNKHMKGLEDELSWVEDADWMEDWIAQTGKGDDVIFALDEVLDHPELYKEAPYLKDIQVTRERLEPNVGGHWDASNNRIVQNSVFHDDADLKKPPEFDMNTIIHEVQHSIQSKEGWVPGSNAKSKEVIKLAGEHTQQAADLSKVLDDLEFNRNELIKERDLAIKNGDANKWDLTRDIHAMDEKGEELYATYAKHMELSDPNTLYRNQLGEQQARASGHAADIAQTHPALVEGITSKDPYGALKSIEGITPDEYTPGTQGILPTPEMLYYNGTVNEPLLDFIKIGK